MLYENILSSENVVLGFLPFELFICIHVLFVKKTMLFFLLRFKTFQCPMALRLKLFMKKRSKMNKGRAVRMNGSKWDLATNHQSLDRLTLFRLQLLIFLVVT